VTLDPRTSAVARVCACKRAMRVARTRGYPALTVDVITAYRRVLALLTASTRRTNVLVARFAPRAN
jgi:hypothetical protein